MERYTVFMDWKHQECYEISSSQIYLDSQFNSNQNNSKQFLVEINELFLYYLKKPIKDLEDSKQIW